MTPELLGAIMHAPQLALPPREVKGEVVLGARVLTDEALHTMVAAADSSQILAATGMTRRTATLETLVVGLETSSSIMEMHITAL